MERWNNGDDLESLSQGNMYGSIRSESDNGKQDLWSHTALVSGCLSLPLSQSLSHPRVTSPLVVPAAYLPMFVNSQPKRQESVAWTGEIRRWKRPPPRGGLPCACWGTEIISTFLRGMFISGHWPSLSFSLGLLHAFWTLTLTIFYLSSKELLVIKQTIIHIN